MSILDKNDTITTCVIGGNGFVGYHVVSTLLALGRKVIILGRSNIKSVLPKGVTYLQNSNSIQGEKNLKYALSNADEIVDLAYATVPQTSFQDPINDILANLPEAIKIFELASLLPIRKFIWLSSGGTVYGKTDNIAVPETHSTFPLSPYGITKLAIEKYAHMYYENKGLPIVCVRPSNAFGEGQKPYSGQGFIATAIASILDGRELTLYGDRGTVRDYLHVTDVAKGIVSALIYGRPGEVYNLGSGVGTDNLEVLNNIAPLANKIKKEIKLKILPSRTFDVPYNVLDSSKLRLETNWSQALNFSSAIEHTWNWYIESNITKK